MNRLKDKVAIITGGAKGIGKATTQRFLEEGARVIIWDIDEAGGQATVEHFKQAGFETVSFMQVNTTKRLEVQQACADIVKAFERIDILVNNAGITRDASLKKITDEQWDQVIAVNLNGVFYCTKAVYPYMAEQKYGRILNASSVVGLYGNFGQTNYVATKAGVIGMTKTWAKELGRKGITVNAIAPGFIHTEMMDTIPTEILDGIRAKTPLGRLGKPEEVANLYLFLASDEAAFITGATFSVDGGVVL